MESFDSLKLTMPCFKYSIVDLPYFPLMYEPGTKVFPQEIPVPAVARNTRANIITKKLK